MSDSRDSWPLPPTGSISSHAFVRPGELNLMTSGHGINHSEVSTIRTTVLHGVQLWVALTEQHRHTARDYQHYEPGATTALAISAFFEHGLLVDSGEVEMAGTLLRPAELGHLGPGNETLTLTNTTDTAARMVLLGGTPFGEQIVMWWNFIGRSHEEIVQARDECQQASDRFGTVEGYDGDRLPPPPCRTPPSPRAKTPQLRP
ncbi:pirin-like C-terminal cupin domain-containing protein [Streptomyces sp. NPDC048275]|uniref:pirin family protein n=1 Tax=Streptomyces sp. NPDC048275 TaxID=3155629 RepID=UPI0033C4F46C